VLGDKQKIMPVSTVPVEYGIKDVCLSVPCIIGRHGIKNVVTMPLSPEEKKKLRGAANVLKQYVDKGLEVIRK